MQIENILQNPVRLLHYALALLIAVGAGFFIANGLGWQVVTIAGFFAIGWMIFFMAQPVTAIIIIVCAKTLTDPYNFSLVGPFTVNALLYCPILAGGLMYCVLNRHWLKHNAASRVYLIFVLYAMPLAVLTPERSQGVAAWVREGSMCMLYYLFVNLMTKRNEQWKYIYMVGGLAVLGVCTSLAQLAGLISPMFVRMAEGRYAGTFGHPNFFAYFLLIPISFASSFLMLTRSRGVRAVCLVMLMLCLTGLVLTFTRGAWIAAMVMFLILGLFGRKWFLLLAAAATLAIYTAIPSVQERLYWLLQQHNINAASAGRLAIWSANLSLVLERPLTGLGLQSFIAYSPFHADAHNSYLKLLFETGAIGLFLYCLFFGMNLWYGYRVWRHARDDYERSFALAFVSFFCAYLVGGFWENLFLGQGTQWFSYSAAGVMAALAQQVKNRQPVVATPAAAPAVAAPVHG